MNEQTIKQLILEAAPLMNEIGVVVEENSDDVWYALLEEERLITMTYDKDSGKFTLLIEIGGVGDSSKADFYEILLRYNFNMLRESEFSTSLGQDGTAMLSTSCHITHLEVHWLLFSFNELIRKTLVFKELIEKLTENTPAESSESLSSSDSGDILRV